ncbi:MAG: hypothetical protein AAF716_07365 [Cyanobacteria bacterium P01_D01_bin.1]
MSSPFSTIEEFNAAIDGPTEGAIYTFANAPAINMIALIVAVGIFVWFIVASYTTHAEPPSVDKSLERLSSFIVIGLLSLVAADYSRSIHSDQTTTASTPARAAQSTSRAAPLALLGMVGIGLPSRRRSKAHPGGSVNNKQAKRRKKRGSRSRNYLR